MRVISSSARSGDGRAGLELALQLDSPHRPQVSWFGDGSIRDPKKNGPVEHTKARLRFW